jgi:hypothetical protein
MRDRCAICRGWIGPFDDTEVYGHTRDGRPVEAHLDCDYEARPVELLRLLAER